MPAHTHETLYASRCPIVIVCLCRSVFHFGNALSASAAERKVFPILQTKCVIWFGACSVQLSSVRFGLVEFYLVWFSYGLSRILCLSLCLVHRLPLPLSPPMPLHSIYCYFGLWWTLFFLVLAARALVFQTVTKNTFRISALQYKIGISSNFLWQHSHPIHPHTNSSHSHLFFHAIVKTIFKFCECALSVCVCVFENPIE